MSGYDPQRGHRRPRPAPAGLAPVDALLAEVPIVETAPEPAPALPTMPVMPAMPTGPSAARGAQRSSRGPLIAVAVVAALFAAWLLRRGAARA